MPDPKNDAKDFDAIFEKVRHDLEAVSSVRPQVEQRIGAAAMEPGLPLLGWSLTASLAILVAGALLGWRFFNTAPRALHEAAMPTMAQDLSLDADGMEFVEHIAAIVDQRVVVIWSYRGAGVSAAAASTPKFRAGKYQFETLYEHKLRDGRTFVCTMFVPEEGVVPILEPPSIYASSADSVFACTVSPRVVSTDELAHAIRSAGEGDKAEIEVSDIFRRIRDENH